MDYQKMSDAELAAEAQSRNISVQGSRDDVIKRLETDDDDGGNGNSPESLSENLERNDKGEVYAEGEQGTDEDADRSKQRPGAGDARDGTQAGHHRLEDPAQRGEETGFTSTEDTKPGTTKAVDKDQPHVPAVPSDR